jgi:single-strand DNA-binding protein
MKNSINKVMLVGNVGEEPKVNQISPDNMVAHFSLATHEHYTDKEGKEVKKTEWHKIVVWNKKAEIVKKYIKKGDPLYVEGKLQTNSWEDKEGIKRTTTEVVCDNLLFLSSKNSN